MRPSPAGSANAAVLGGNARSPGAALITGLTIIDVDSNAPSTAAAYSSAHDSGAGALRFGSIDLTSYAGASLVAGDDKETRRRCGQLDRQLDVRYHLQQCTAFPVQVRR